MTTEVRRSARFFLGTFLAGACIAACGTSANGGPGPSPIGDASACAMACRTSPADGSTPASPVDSGAHGDAGLVGEASAGDDASMDAEASTVDAAGPAGDDGGFPISGPTGSCNAVVQQHVIEGFFHVAECSVVMYGTKPPSSGNHYPIWAAYQSYPSAIPEGYWVHDLEHGAVVLTYNCPSGCASDVAAAQAFINALPQDPICNPAGGDPPRRITMAPDPNLDVRFAASAWGWTLRADCFDPVAFGAFVTDHYGQGPEVLCAQGEDVTGACGDQ